ncbi:MAG: biotin synthase BioB [Legionellaceae bacterium]
MPHHAWNEQAIMTLLDLPFFELISRAYAVHKENFDPANIEFLTLLTIKTGTCPEDCAYCPQSGHYKTGLKKETLMDDLSHVLEKARAAKAQGSTRFCMGAAWRTPPQKEFPKVLEMIQHVKALGMETCVTLGMLDQDQARALKEAGLDFYNHNLDTSPEYYQSIITTRTYQDRLDTLQQVIKADIKVCCGGILGMGESRADRIALLLQLHQLPKAPESIPMNQLMPIKGTPLEHAAPLDSFEFIKTIAVARIMFPSSRLRLSAGRERMSDETQAWCFMAGANSIFIGDKLLTAPNPSQQHDLTLLKKLNMDIPQTCN